MSETTHDPKDPDYLLDVIGRQNGAIRKLIAERDELRALLEANGQKLDALTCLQRTYNNPDSTETNRIKAAAAAIGFELPKKATTNLVADVHLAACPLFPQKRTFAMQQGMSA